ncbi:ovarian cancer G-protein coupled receptor 1-like [Cheilinus undulatus]|uniref:ovarian cancer G-protein coupled receptor 1-like n=1 Tax=Cheilinus undulatus TaxID=241271 RepID=UPI001BD4A828|nr:ovarian cancer G-protein coupled receptor 1-like [Cheilinus undulatus]
MANISVNTTLLDCDDLLGKYYDKYTTLLNDSHVDPSQTEYCINLMFIMRVVSCIIICIGLPLTLIAIYALYSLVKNGHVAPIYIINLFISDIIQLCFLIVRESRPKEWMKKIIVGLPYSCVVLTSVGFMLCISLERYLVIAHPLWYRFRRTIRISVAVCVVVWIIPPIYYSSVYPWLSDFVRNIVFSLCFIIPLPLLIFFLVGTLSALSTSVSVPSDEKQRIVAILVLVLLIYTLLFLPTIIVHIASTKFYDSTLHALSNMSLRLSPLADLLLYVFIKKETFEKLWTYVCCCRKENNDTNTNTINLDHM